MHTPGPWFQENASSRYVLAKNKDKNGINWYVAEAFSGPTEAQIGANNARLIAAAPELLEALQNALNVMAGIATGDLKTIGRDSQAIAKARAAIAKAKGE